MRRIVATAVTLALLAVAGAATAATTDRGGVPAGKGGGSVPQFPRLAGLWSHAEINVTIRRVQHTLILDQGRITKASPTEITLLRPDGTPAVIQLSPKTIVVIRGRHRPAFTLRRKMFAQTMRIDDGPAVRVRITR
jgi:hypothetical protein